jgi:CIC family chloride channel protein
MSVEAHPRLEAGATAGGLPVAPSFSAALEQSRVRGRVRPFVARGWLITGLSVLVACVAFGAAQVLGALINLSTNLAMFGRWSIAPSNASQHLLGSWILVVPAVGGLIVGLMARYGSAAIRGHGIPEAMERVLEHESRIPLRMTLLKPLSAAIAIGTGGPFGAEGPIIATGGALGSMLGQLVSTTAKERKTLLAAGAAAGMAATFGTPVSAVLLAIELLLFELAPGSLIPVAIGTATATALRMALLGSAPVFVMPQLADPSGAAIAGYALLGLLIGASAVVITRLVYFVEEQFERLPIHFMWWPLLGGLAVGAVGFYEPRVLGVGYDNIEHIIAGDLASAALLSLCLCKLVAWSISLGSGTSGGTLAPLFTIGGALGGLLGVFMAKSFPGLGIDPRLAGLLGMAAMFAGASRALLASAVFAFETTRQGAALLPLLAACSAAYLMSCTFMRHSIMTRKIEQRGVRVPGEYVSDLLGRVAVLKLAAKPAVVLQMEQTVEEVRAFMLSDTAGSSHQGYPVVNAQGELVGVITRRDIFARGPGAGEPETVAALLRRAPLSVYDDASLEDAVRLMVQEDIGRVPVVRRGPSRRVIGIVTRSDVLRAYKQRMRESDRIPGRFSRKRSVAAG